MGFEIVILGCSSATPVLGRNSSAQYIQINGNYFLIDCGEGTQQQMLRFGISCQKIEAIFISHLHGDHYLGLVGLLSTMHLNGRTKKMKIFAPEPLQKIIEIQLEASCTQLNFELEYFFTQIEQPEILIETSDIRIETLILNHRIPCTGFKISQIFPKRKLIKEKIENIPSDLLIKLKNAENVQLPNGEWLDYKTVSIAGKSTKSYAYCSDTKPDEKYWPQIHKVDYLYHEATFLHELLDRAEYTHHTTALQAAQIAQKSEVKNLILGHFSSRYKDCTPLLNEAKKVFESVVLAYDGMKFEV